MIGGRLHWLQGYAGNLMDGIDLLSLSSRPENDNMVVNIPEQSHIIYSLAKNPADTYVSQSSKILI